MRSKDNRLILASTSPRRRDLVRHLGLPFEFVPVDVDESPRTGELPEPMVRRLSQSKVTSGARAFADALVVAADTVVALDDTILGKPNDEQDAVHMLKLLRGRSHIVYTGLALEQAGRRTQYIATTTVWMRDYSDAEIDAYVATGDPLDKAAAYAIQHSVFHPVARIEGCYANVMGLPLCRLYLGLKEFGVEVPDPQSLLTSQFEIDCPVSQDIRRRLSTPH